MKAFGILVYIALALFLGSQLLEAAVKYFDANVVCLGIALVMGVLYAVYLRYWLGE